MFYHVLIETNENKMIYQSNLSKQDIHHIMLDYLAVNEFQINGYYLLKNNLKRFQILESKEDINEIIEIKELEMNYNGITEDDIFTYIEQCKDIMQDITRKIISSYNNSKKTIEKEIYNITKNVFIVHGHDESLKYEIESFIKDLSLNPIVLHKQASEGTTIIEKIENQINEVSYGIVLYSPCDVGGKNINELQSRARQNVIFEHGLLIGRLGRKNTCAIVKGDLEKPNDISGLVYISHDNGEGWKIQLFRELKKVFKELKFNI